MERDAVIDGRRLRREQNRDAVLDALLSLFEDGIYAPGAGLIAERAGISERSLFRYFDDIDDLSRAAIERAVGDAGPLFELSVDATLPTATKITMLVDARLELFEATAAPARAARIGAHRHAAVAAQLHGARGHLRRQVAELFAPELAGPRSVLLPAVDALCQFETYDLLAVEHRLSHPKIAAALTAALTELLGD
jgi:AcrR family transcriptional regulator